jgi:hypothetical protein
MSASHFNKSLAAGGGAWRVDALNGTVAVLYLAGRPIAATGSSDAGRFCDGHVRSGAADVRVDAAVGFGLTLYPVRRLHLAVELDAVATFSFGGYRTADSPFISARAGGRVAMKLDIAKNLLR